MDLIWKNGAHVPPGFFPMYEQWLQGFRMPGSLRVGWKSSVQKEGTYFHIPHARYETLQLRGSTHDTPDVPKPNHQSIREVSSHAMTR